ncbi:MAG: LysR family transcriptional regulator [Alphaproteobacteria bacterium]|nr:LysR family transcriptional regulator [Alphaproteobacteria bacterium]
MTPLLDIRHLSMLTAIAETDSVTLAAGRLGITQSALTHRIREAERRLQTALFTRVGRRLIMTPAAEHLHAAAVRVIDELSRAEDEVRTMSESDRRLVRLGQGTYSRFHWLPEFLRFFGDRAPDLEVDLVARATHYPLTALLEGAVDVALVYGAKQATSQFQWFHLIRDPLVAVMAPDHALADRPFIGAEDLVEERYITYSVTPEPGFEWEAVMRPANLFPRRVSRVQLPEAIIDLVRAGFGVSILSAWAVEPEVNDGTLVARPVTEKGLTLDWWAVMRRGEGDDAPARRLVDSLLTWGGRDEGGLDTLGFQGTDA